MSDFDASLLQTLTQTLARNIVRRYESEYGRLSGTPFEAAVTAALEPAAAAFLGRLTAALPDALWLPDVIEQFFDDPAAAGALIRLLAGERDAAGAAAEAFAAAGAQIDQLSLTDFEEALDRFVAAATLAARRQPPRVPLEQGEKLLPTSPPFARWPAELPPYVVEETERFIKEVAAQGLDRVVAGHALAANGMILFAWQGVPLTSVEPPQEIGPLGEIEPGGRDDLTGGVQEAIPQPPVEPKPEPPPAEPSPSPPSRPPIAPEPTAPEPSSPTPQPVLESAAVSLRLDAAAPERVTTGRPFDLAVAIRRPESPPLAPDDLTRRDSAPFAVSWPAGATFLSMRIEISAPDCDLHGPNAQSVRLPRGQDGPTVYFQLTPRRAGPLSVIITVYQETDWIGSARLRTEAGADEPRGALAMTVESGPAGAPAGGAASPPATSAPPPSVMVSQPLGNFTVNQKTLRDALDAGYNLSELRDLCFELEIDYDNLGGEGKAAKARELVLHAKRNGLLAALVGCVMRDRPHLLAPV